MPAKIVIHHHSGVYSFDLIVSSGDTVLHSEKFGSLIVCRAAAKYVQQCSIRKERFHKIDLPEGQYYFVFKDEQDDIIATSDKFGSTLSRDYVLKVVMRECEDAVVVNE